MLKKVLEKWFDGIEEIPLYYFSKICYTHFRETRAGGYYYG